MGCFQSRFSWYIRSVNINTGRVIILAKSNTFFDEKQLAIEDCFSWFARYRKYIERKRDCVIQAKIHSWNGNILLPV